MVGQLWRDHVINDIDVGPPLPEFNGDLTELETTTNMSLALLPAQAPAPAVPVAVETLAPAPVVQESAGQPSASNTNPPPPMGFVKKQNQGACSKRARDNVKSELDAVRSLVGCPPKSTQVEVLRFARCALEAHLSLKGNVTALEEEATRLRPLEAEVARLRPFEAEVERLKPLEGEVTRLRPLEAEVEFLRKRVAELESLTLTPLD